MHEYKTFFFLQIFFHKIKKYFQKLSTKISNIMKLAIETLKYMPKNASVLE